MTSDNPSISVIIPTYNRSSYIVKTIETLLDQKEAPLEIIVVDDGSTDDTENVINKLSDNRIKYYKKDNAERAAARNYGANLAKGEYLNFFDSDDLAYSNHICKAKEAIINFHNPEIFHLGYDIKDSEGKLVRKAEVWPDRINDKLIEGNHLSCNGVFIRYDVWKQNQFNENRILSASEDYELWLRLAARYPIHCVSGITSTVVNHEARSVLKINLEKFLSRIQLLQDELESDGPFMRRYGHQLSLFKSYLNIYIALHLALANYPKSKSLRYLKDAALLRPAVILNRRFLAALKNILI